MMSKIYFAKNNSVSRRTLLRGAGVAMALPLLDSMKPAFGKLTRSAAKAPKRFVGISSSLGFHAPFLFPKKSGPNTKRRVI